MSALRRSTGDMRPSSIKTTMRDDQDDAATYVASYLDLHGGRPQSQPSPSSYRFMKKGHPRHTHKQTNRVVNGQV